MYVQCLSPTLCCISCFYILRQTDTQHSKEKSKDQSDLKSAMCLSPISPRTNMILSFTTEIHIIQTLQEKVIKQKHLAISEAFQVSRTNESVPALLT